MQVYKSKTGPNCNDICAFFPYIYTRNGHLYDGNLAQTDTLSYYYYYYFATQNELQVE